jgi:hypothetical protein
MTPRALDGQTVALPGTRWRLWRDACIRSAGFPARRVLSLCDPGLARAADAGWHPGAGGQATNAAAGYAAAYQAATARLPGLMAGLAAEPLFREAVTWQNPGMVENWFDRLAPDAPRDRKGRKRELSITTYLQRYGLKNDTIGFFGPVGWAWLSDDEDTVVQPGDRLLAERSTYFEVWAIDQVATVIAQHDGVAGWLRPRRDRSSLLAGNRLHRPLHKPAVLSPAQLTMLSRCDGRRTVTELVADSGPGGAAVLASLRDLGAVRAELAVPVQARPERALRWQIEQVPDAAVRDAALRPLNEITDARDAVATAAGNPDKLLPAMAELARVFERITGRQATRRPGGAYAGRTLVYEDTVRDVRVRLGPSVTGALAQPLGLVLDSACWLAGEVAERYRALFGALFDRECRRAKTDRVPLSRLILMATPDLLTPSSRSLTEITTQVLAEFQQRWQALLEIPAGPVTRHHVRSADLAGRAAALFPARPPAWSGAAQHSPDVMIAAASADALRRGDFALVLGELHVAINTLEARVFVEQHPDPARLLAAAGADHSGRVVTMPRKDSPFVTSRTCPPTALPSPAFTYVSGGNDAFEPPAGAAVLPAAGLLVSRDGADLVVTCAASGARLTFFEAIGDVMTSVVGSAFRPIGPAPHQPRITIDRLVLARESWTFAMADAAWAFAKDEAQRYAQARRWRQLHRLPEEVFYKVPTEDKPFAADFRSLTLVNLLAKNVRQAKEAGFASFGVSEMLPDTGQLWLPDAAGERYTCEFRFVATSTGAAPDLAAAHA